jgi:tetratricopeptide (TPR) repeat protein
LLVLVDHAHPERLGELVRALLPLAPELEVHTEAHRLAEARPGSTLVLVGRAEDADWLNINRPLFASRALRVVLFCSREVSVALSRGAVDFLDWMSLRVECPPGPAPYAVAGLRRALAARVPGIVWTGGDLEASFAAARPRQRLRRVSAARPYEELVAEVKAGSRRDWIAWTEVDDDFRLRRVRWALAEAGRRTRTLLIEPAVRSPGWWEVHGRVMAPGEASTRLTRSGAEQPGRLAALVNLEPEAIELLCGLLERGLGERALEKEIEQGTDPGATIGQMAVTHGLVSEKELTRGRAPPSAMRAFGAARSRMKLLHAAELDAIYQRLSKEEPVATEDVAWWSTWVGTRSSEEHLGSIGRRSELAEALLRHVPRTASIWEQATRMALSVGDLEVAQAWAQTTTKADPSKWEILPHVLLAQGRLAEAESLFRRQLTANETSGLARRRILHNLGYALHQQGKYAEAEELLRQSLALTEQAFGPQHPNYGTSLHVLAMVLSRQVRYTEAEELLRQSLEVFEQALGPRHRDYGSSLHELAWVLGRQGRFAEAEGLLRQALALKEQALGPWHPDHGASLHELARVLERQGRHAEAEELLRQSVEVIEQTLGPRHPYYGVALHSLAMMLASHARHAEAEELMRRSLEIIEQTHGPRHPTYGASLHELARVLENQGRHVEAEVLLRQSLTVLVHALGPGHPDYGSSLHELARVLESQGRYAEAEELLRQALALKEQALGPLHPGLCPTLANLGFNLAKQKRVQQGEPFLQRSVDIARQTWGSQHPETAQALSLLARVQAALRKPEAVTTAQEAMNALLGSLGAEHPITKDALPGLQRILAGGG